MRKDIHRSPRIGQLEQGSIFNCCVAEEYVGRNVYGIIITPRCDISNEKVTTFHYLPVVKYQDWLRVDFWELFRKVLEKNLKGRLAGLLKNKNISPRVIEAFNISDVVNQFSPSFTKKKELDKFNELAQDLSRLTASSKHSPMEDEFLYFFIKYEKVSKSILGEVRRNLRNSFYLIEGFLDAYNLDYYVVLSREVRRITFDMGTRIARGLSSDELTPYDYIKNDLYQNQKPVFISVLSVIRSPILEHLIQHFNENFARIGVKDHPATLVDDLFNNC